MCDCGGGSDSAEAMRRDEAERQRKIRQGLGWIDKTFAGFDKPFYQERVKTYQDYALPELAKQYTQARNSLVFTLGNRGILGGSAGQQLGTSLETETAKKKREIADTGLSMSQALEKQVEDQRSALVAQLQASADPTLAKQGALASATRFSAPSPMAPVGNAFADWANIYLQNRLNQQASQGQVWQPPVNTGWMGSTMSTSR